MTQSTGTHAPDPLQAPASRWRSTDELPPDQVEAFERHAVARSAGLIRVIATLALVGALGFWPLDPISLPDNPEAQRAFFVYRIATAPICMLYLYIESRSAWVRRHAPTIYTISTVVVCGLTGALVAELGGLNGPWFYFGYCIAGMTTAVMVPLMSRIWFTVAICYSWNFGFFYHHPEHFAWPLGLAVLGVQAMTIACSVAMGHGLYVFARRNWAQRNFIERTFARYFDADVAAAVLSHHAGHTTRAQERVVTVLFSDLQGYSTVVEQAAPQDVLAFLNAYFAAMQEVIESHHGTVLEYIGDGILVVFGAPGDLKDHADHAVRCARSMQIELAALHRSWKTSGRDALWRDVGMTEIRSRIGVHTGRVVAGTLGGERFMKYGLIGDAVNVAARLEQLNKELGTSILVSDDTRVMLSDLVASTLVARGTAQVRGRSQEVRIWSS